VELVLKRCTFSLSSSTSNVGITKDEFITFINRAVDKSSTEYKELYFFLLKTFQARIE
jgi:hypothetical protein